MRLTLTLEVILVLYGAAWAAGGRGPGLSSALDSVTWSTCLYEPLTKHLHRLAAKYSTTSRLISIGKSVEGRDLWVMIISDSPVERPLLRPQVKFVGNIIGNSGPTCYVLLKLIFNLLEGFKQEKSLERRLVETNEIHILPNMNPDGFMKSIPGACGGGQGRLNAAGFDLNRDFPDPFNFQEGKRLQPETLAVMKWVETNSFVCSLSFLSGSLVVSYPFDSVPLNTDSPIEGPHLTPDDDMFKHLASTYVKNVREGPEEREPAHFPGASYQYCPPLRRTFDNGIVNGARWQPASGTMLDYNYEEGTFELMAGVSCCRNENKTDKLEEIWRNNQMAMLRMISETEYGLRGQVTDAETHKPIRKAILIKTSQNHRLNAGIHPMPWRSTAQGEFWRLILPGKYVLQVRAPGYEEKSITFEINFNEFTLLLVELNKLKKSSEPSMGLHPETQDDKISDGESSLLDKTDPSSVETEKSEDIEPSYSISGKINLIVSSCSSTTSDFLLVTSLALIFNQW